jgi:protein TonB
MSKAAVEYGTPRRSPGRRAQVVELRRAPARALFQDSLLASGRPPKTHRGWTVMLSFLLQGLLLAGVAILPMLFVESLPARQLVSYLVAPPPPPPPPPAPAPAVARHVLPKIDTNIINGRLRTPTRIPQRVAMIKESAAPPPVVSSGGVVGGVPGGIPGGTLGGVMGGILSSTAHPILTVKPKAPIPPARIRVSQGVSRGLLIQRVEPVYPAMAKLARVQGQVVLHAIISRQGTIEDLQVVSGHPMLINAAMEAVRQWRYRPYRLNGQPVEVDTIITVNFQLQ